MCIPCLLTGGTEVQTLNLVQALVEGGHEVVTVCYFEHSPVMVERFRLAGSRGGVALAPTAAAPVGGAWCVSFMRDCGAWCGAKSPTWRTCSIWLPVPYLSCCLRTDGGEVRHRHGSHGGRHLLAAGASACALH